MSVYLLCTDCSHYYYTTFSHSSILQIDDFCDNVLIINDVYNVLKTYFIDL